MPNHADIVTKLLSDAIMKATHPQAHLLNLAEGLTAPGSKESLPTGIPRKMKENVAHRAMIAVTRMMRRYGLKPSDICTAANVANAPNEFYKFHLAAKEMDKAGNLTAPLPAGRRVHRGVGPYVRMTREIARQAIVPEADLLQELGTEIADFLASFAATDKSPWELLAGDLALLGPYLAKVQPGADGEPIDVPRYFAESRRGGVVYSPVQARMLPEPDEMMPDAGFWQCPTVPLFVRTVAVGVGVCRIYKKTTEGGTSPTSIGEVKVNVVEVISVGVEPAGKGLRTVFFAEPWTVIMGRPGDGTARSWMDRAISAFEQGTPFSGGLRIPQTDNEFYDVSFDDETVRFTCPTYEHHVWNCLPDAAFGEAQAAVQWYCDELVNVARRVELDPETLRIWLESESDEKWRTLLSLRKSTPAFATSLTLPGEVALTGGQSSDRLLDRLKEALYGDGQAIVKALMEVATSRVRAMDVFMAERTDAERWRRERFRRLMRT